MFDELDTLKVTEATKQFQTQTLGRVIIAVVLIGMIGIVSRGCQELRVSENYLEGAKIKSETIYALPTAVAGPTKEWVEGLAVENDDAKTGK